MNVLKNDICDIWMTHVTYDSFICHWSIICDIWMTHVTYASFICHWSMWHITHPSVTYEWHIKNPDIGTVIRVTMSRQLQIIGLFCKRALWKRLYPEKETYIIEEPFKLPTNRHSAGDGMTIWHAMTVCPLDTEWHWMTSSFNVQWTHRDMESNRMTSSFGDGMTMAFNSMSRCVHWTPNDIEWHRDSVTEWQWHSIPCSFDTEGRCVDWTANDMKWHRRWRNDDGIRFDIIWHGRTVGPLDTEWRCDSIPCHWTWNVKSEWCIIRISHGKQPTDPSVTQ